MTTRQDREETEHYVVEERPFGRARYETLVVRGAWSPEAEARLLQGDIDCLELNAFYDSETSQGFRGSEVEFLEGLPVRRLRIIDLSLEDLSPVGLTATELQVLAVHVPRAPLDLLWLPALEHLSASWDQLEQWDYGVEDLRSVFLTDYDGRDLERLALASGLESLELSAPTRLESLRGIDRLPALSALEIAVASRLRDLGALPARADSLVRLQLDACRRISDLSVVAHLGHLMVLGFADGGSVSSLTPLESLTELRELLVYGTTRVEDGDLSVLTRLPKLEKVAMQNRRSYSPSVAEVQAQIEARAPSSSA